MDFMEIIQIIIQIITTLLEIFGGGGPFQMDSSQLLKAEDYNCRQVVWASSPRLSGDAFTGTLERECVVYGQSGKGIAGLYEFLNEEVPKSASRVHSGPYAKYMGNLRGQYYDMTMDYGQGEAEVRGSAHIASDGHSRLKSVFRSRENPEDLEYVNRFFDSVEVEALGGDRYRVKLRFGSKVEAPEGVNRNWFVNKLADRSEEEMEDRTLIILSKMAQNL